jgi:hypothetical protein
MTIQKEVRWCDWPLPEHARELDELAKVGARCDAWRQFMKSEALAVIKMSVNPFCWFNAWENFDRLILELDCGEGELRAAINDRLRPQYKECSYGFKRMDIWDSRSWCTLPLEWFVEGMAGFGASRNGKRPDWPETVLTHNDMPVLQFGIKLPWTVGQECFWMEHKIKRDPWGSSTLEWREAFMFFDHPDIDKRFKGRRWAADGKFAVAATRSEMEEALWEVVLAKCKTSLVTVVEGPFGKLPKKGKANGCQGAVDRVGCGDVPNA